ncbi:MAG: DUF1624 domain-containing protein [Holophagaceae bacterium]|nr:DUF1624 domain-containing protein [Holophagaceae bacterium]
MTEGPRPRLDAIDLLRGLVMVIMLLDHTRDFVHAQAFQFDPLDLAKTTPALFATRWITHFCAPVFVFLAGTGAWLQLQRGRPKGELSTFLLSRGLWLVFLEFTAVRIGAFWNLDYRFLGMAQVIWAIGVSMVVLAALIHLPWSAVLGFGLVLILGHNALDGIKVAAWAGPGSPVPAFGARLWIILHQGGPLPVAGWPSPVIVFFYPLIPWIGVMAAGFAFGRLYGLEVGERRRWLLRLGLITTVGFVLLRATNLYGNPTPWATQKNTVFTFMSFINFEKYPPSLLYLMATLGPALLALAWFEGSGRGWLSKACITFGRVPLFYYLLQWPTAHGISWVLHKAAGKPTAWLSANLDVVPPAGVGFSLGVVYASWIVGLVLLYPLCVWFAGVKARRKEWWLSYL